MTNEMRSAVVKAIEAKAAHFEACKANGGGCKLAAEWCSDSMMAVEVYCAIGQELDRAMLEADEEAPVAEVALHPFERAGLGMAPFEVIGVESKVGPLDLGNGHTVGAPGQPMGTCRYCGQGIRECWLIRSADGRTFDVGCDCVRKAGGVSKSKAGAKALRALAKAKRAAQAEARIAKAVELLGTPRVRELLGAQARTDAQGRSSSMLGWVEWMLGNAGTKGKLEAARWIEMTSAGKINLRWREEELARGRRYEVHIHEAGRKVIERGPAAGCLDFPKHRWSIITRRPLGLASARRIADEQSIHAVVCVWRSSEKAYDNGKAPGVPAGWRPPSAGDLAHLGIDS